VQAVGRFRGGLLCARPAFCAVNIGH
jgi:hypothetical protein